MTADERELYEERAAIMEIHGRLTREEAERLAWAIITGTYVDPQPQQMEMLL